MFAHVLGPGDFVPVRTRVAERTQALLIGLAERSRGRYAETILFLQEVSKGEVVIRYGCGRVEDLTSEVGSATFD